MSGDDITSSEAKDLAEELSRLTRQQYEALQRASYLHMSANEAAEYDERRIRIGELCGVLGKFRPQ
jgi:hypothetical protein